MTHAPASEPGPPVVPAAERAPLLVDRVDPDHPTHRERLIEAMAESVRERTFRATTVADVVRGARTSRRTFYEHFASREACFLEMFDEMNRVLSQRIAAAFAPAATWVEQVDAAVSAYIDEATAEPELVVACAREIPAVGEEGVARQHREIEQFADLLLALVGQVGESAPVVPMDRETAILLTGGLRELVIHGLDRGTPPSHMKATAASVIKSVLDPAHRAWTGVPPS